MAKTIYSNEHKNLVGKLKKAREEAGFNQTAAARLLGLTQSYISKVESGQRRVDVVQLKRFAQIYRKNLTYFLE